MTAACVFGCAGAKLSAEEAAFFRDAQPWGFILFGRNVETPDQVRDLVRALRDSVERPDAPVLIDQEGGRVQRLRPPHWRSYPPASAYRGTDSTIAWLGGRLIGWDLSDLGVNVDCAPVLDLPTPGAHDIIGDRAFGDAVASVVEQARAFAEGLLAGGVLPIIKHIPGHGRAGADSHLDLPVVAASRDELDKTDFAPFKALSDLPMAMTAHVVYAAIDRDRPATTSAAVIGEVIRGAIGFQGLLISDDLSMQALSGDLGARAKAALAAGCDVVLHCNGDPLEMRAVAANTHALTGSSMDRAQAALARLAPPAPFDIEAARARFEEAFSDRRAA